MRKFFTTLCLFSLCCFGATQAHAAGTPFEIEYNFDAETGLPDGWLIEGSNFRHDTATNLGISAGAHSGDNVLGAPYALAADVIYTPMMKLTGGEPCTIEFQFITPEINSGLVSFYNYSVEVTAGNAQTAAAQTISVGTFPGGDYKTWQLVKFSFTPETDGEYCFALNPKCSVDNMAEGICKQLAFDSFKISGTAPGGDEPLPADAITVDFEDDALFPGVAVVPTGWASTGVKPFTRKTTAELQIPVDAPSGTYVLGNAAAATNENNLLITPLYDVKAGKTATMQFKFYAPTSNMVFGYGFKIYAAPAQDTPLAEATLIGDIAEDVNRVSEFLDSETFKYTPDADATFCFIVSPYNAYGYTPQGAVAFDNFVFTGVTPHQAEEPDPGPGPDDPTPSGPTEAFELECNFDVDADFPDGANLPAGWAQEGSGLVRGSGMDYGWSNHSGDYILSTNGSCKFNEVLYTPLVNLVAGKPCDIEFYYIAPGGSPSTVKNIKLVVKAGTAQTAEAQTIVIKENPGEGVADWKKYAYTFTPETDGEYCFSIALVSNGFTSQCGSAGFDDFFISGTRYAAKPDDPQKELEPNDEYLADCVDLPYMEDFSDPTHYDGTSYLPKGWHSTGTVTWRTANLPAVEAHAGDYYMVADHNTTGERDDKAYTPFFNLTAETEYTVSYWAYIQGNAYNEDENLVLPELAFTVGTEHDAEFHNTLDRFSEKTAEWVYRTHTFTPKVSGPYCFGFMLTGATNSGMVFIDDLTVTAAGLVARVEPAFVPCGLYSMMSTSTMLFEGQALKMANTSKYADSYEWTAEGAEPSTSTEAEPSFTFPADGEYTITLAATNARGTRSTQHKVQIEHITRLTADDQALTIYKDGQDRLMQRGQVPTFDTDPEGDFVTGYNHYYFDLAQRFDFTEEIPVKVKQLQVYVTDRRYRNQTEYYDDQRIRPFSVVFYGAKADGTLDENNVLGRLDTTIGEALGSSGLGGNNSDPRDIVFEQPIEVRGTFYVAMHFDRGMEVIPQNIQLGRSYISTSAIRHAHGKTSLFVKPIDKPAMSGATLGEWCPVDALDVKQKGLGAYWILWCSAYDQAASAMTPEGALGFAATFIGDELCVNGTAAGQTVSIFNLAGALVASAPADDAATAVALPGLPSGVYVVKCGENTAKVVK